MESLYKGFLCNYIPSNLSKRIAIVDKHLAISTTEHLDSSNVYSTFFLPIQLALVAVVAEYSCNGIFPE